MDYSATAALLPGIPQDRILNFMPRDQLLVWASQTRHINRPAA